MNIFFFFSSRRRHTRCYRDWSSDVCSSDLTGLGTLLRLVPWAMLPAAAVWLGVTVSVRYVSLGSILAALCAALGALLLGYPGPSVLAAFGVGTIVVVRHHANIARLLAGHEPKLGQRRTSP